MTPRSLILMKAFWIYGRFSEAISFSKFATSLSKVTIDVPTFFHCLASLAKVSALALKNVDSTNKKKHSLRNVAVLQSGGSYSKKFLPTVNGDFWYYFENEIASEILL